MTMLAIDMTAQFGWLPTAMNTLLMISAAAIGAHVWANHRSARQVPIGITRTSATVTAIAFGSHSAPATAEPAPSVTSLPEAA
jgi:hypothetical protein